MGHELEETGAVASFAFAGDRKDVWHRLGQQVDGAMSSSDVMRLAHMDRHVRIEKVTTGADWSIPDQYLIILEGKAVEHEGEFVVLPDKVVGIHGAGGAESHANFSIHDRLLYAEQAIHVSSGEAVWSTGGMLRGGTQFFACMEAPPVIIDPRGIADVIRSYLTMIGSFDGTRSTELGASHVRVLCANTMNFHDYEKLPIIKVRHTSGTAADRMKVAAQQWAMAQDRTKALKLRAEELLAVTNGQAALARVLDHFDPKPAADASKRTITKWTKRRELVELVSLMPTNDVGENGWFAYNVFSEYLDHYADVRTNEGENASEARLGNQFDGIHDRSKAVAAELILA